MQVKPTKTQSGILSVTVLTSPYITVNGKTNTDCAWYYPVPSKEAEKIKGRVAFWNGVQVI